MPKKKKKRKYGKHQTSIPQPPSTPQLFAQSSNKITFGDKVALTGLVLTFLGLLLSLTQAQSPRWIIGEAWTLCAVSILFTYILIKHLTRNFPFPTFVLSSLAAISVCLLASRYTLDREREKGEQEEKRVEQEAKQAKEAAKRDAEERYIVNQRQDLLTPDDVPFEVRSGTLALCFGNSTVYTTQYFPAVAIQQNDEKMITFAGGKEGLYVNATFYNKEGAMVCQIHKNQLIQNDQNVLFVEHPDHGFRVIDNKGVTTLDIHYLNPSAIHILGDFYLKNGFHVKIDEDQQTYGDARYSGNKSFSGGAAYVFN